jgi:tetratricopeptide (TPR) repeat protein
LGIVELAEGNWEEADRHLAAGLAVAQRQDDLQAIRAAHRWLAERDLLQGHPQQARARLQPLLDRSGLEELQVAPLLAPLVLAHLELGDVEQAEDILITSLERTRRQSHRLALVDLLRVQGMLLSRQGRWEEAEDAFKEAVSVSQRMPYPYAEARARYEWGQMLRAKDQPLPAQERLEEALVIFRRLGVRPHVERTERALAATQLRRPPEPRLR